MIKHSYGSVIGKYHISVGKNNQDAYSFNVIGDKFVGVVCDGCGSCKCSEVGSKLGSAFVSKTIAELFLSESSEQGCLNLLKFEELKQRTVDFLKDLAEKIDSVFIEAVKNYLLFTIVGTFCDGENVYIFSMGDGFYALNGVVHKIGPYENNMPPYIAYNTISNFVNKDIEQDYLNFKIHSVTPLTDFQSVMIGTDGIEDLINSSEKNIPGKKELVGSINQFWENNLYFRNESAMDRRLTLINREFSVAKDGWLQHEKGHLKDDTTLIVFRKFEEE